MPRDIVRRVLHHVTNTKLTTLPWDQIPRPLALLLVLLVLSIVGLPFYWAPGAHQTAATLSPQDFPERARTGSSTNNRAARPLITGRQSAALEEKSRLAFLIDSNRLRWSQGFGVIEAAAALNAQPIKAGEWSSDNQQSIAEIIVGQGLRWGLNPQVLIVLLDLKGVPQKIPFGARTGGPAPSSSQQISDEQSIERVIGQLARELRIGLLEPPATRLVLADGSFFTVPQGIGQGSYALLRLLAGRSDSQQLQQLLGDGPESFVAAFGRRFDDPRLPMRSTLSDAPFLHLPFSGSYPAAARFDHRYPIFELDGLMRAGTPNAILGYDGHNGWDYVMPEGTPITAAAAGYVLFAGTMDNECETRAGAVIIEHANGYRTLYWHLRQHSVSSGINIDAGELIGESGATGCASGAHLHFGVQRLGRDIDPYGWCAGSGDPWRQHPAGARSTFLWVDQPNPCPLPNGASIADDSDASTTFISGEGWYLSEQGNSSDAHFTYGKSKAEATIVWKPAIPHSGRYRCYVFLPSSAINGGMVTYRISHAGGVTGITLNQGRMAGSWANLGAYHFTDQQPPRIELRDSGDQPDKALWVDAVGCAKEPG